MARIRRFKDRLKEDLRDPEFRKSFDEEEIYASLAIQIAKLREQRHLTQVQLAKLLDTKQQTVSRFEDQKNRRYSVRTLINIAHALNKRLEIKFVA